MSVATGFSMNVTELSVTLSGNVTLIDSENITCGVIYGTSSNLSSSNGAKALTNANGEFEVKISGLKANTTYYYRAYAVDAGRYKYGDIRSFRTKKTEAIAVDVDLGLSVKWASCNVGADAPEDYGGYYAWGETEEKSNYSWDTYKYWSDRDGDGNIEESEITNIGPNISGTSYDVAHVKWGGSWRMPTSSEIKELCNKCSWEWTSINGVGGQKVTGPNGNSIFLPAAGFRSYTTDGYRGSDGYYWSGTLTEDDSDSAYCLNFDSGGNYGHIVWILGGGRYGLTVRPVTEAISVTTGTATDISASGATLSGSITNATQPMPCGVIYGISPTLSSTSGTIVSTTSDGNFSLKMTELSENTTYYYRAYVVVDGEYFYGDTKSFKTKGTDLCPDANHVHAVDLGLSVKWACCNVGADVPEGYGGYYAWGETEEKSDYDWDTYQYYIDTDGDWQDRWQNIGSNISGTSYDVAHVKWGDGWRMPTLAEIQELCEKCSWEWTSVNGVWGEKVTGPNGNSIFLPAAGIRYGTEIRGRGSGGNYWSGTLGEDGNYGAYCLDFSIYGSGYWNDWNSRDYGLTVRPVTE